MKSLFSILAAKPELAKRHRQNEKKDIIRTEFDRDRDRVLFSKEFRRLEGKTQVFVIGFDDHIRNRLTHTLEVSQIAQTITKYFGLNFTLAEAIAFAHDVGHTPFGHTGERVLSHFTNNCGSFNNWKILDEAKRGFKHNWQGLRVLCSLERIKPLYQGLNLTDHTLWGVLYHSSLKYDKCKYFADGVCNYRQIGSPCHVDSHEFSLGFYDPYLKYLNSNSWTMEALIINHADEIAQRHHDIEDGLFAGIIDQSELVIQIQSIFSNFLETEEKTKLTKMLREKNKSHFLHDLSSLLLRFYSRNLINYSSKKMNGIINEYSLKDTNEFYTKKDYIKNNEDIFRIIGFEDEFSHADESFRKYLEKRILNSHLAQSMDGKAGFILKNLIEAYLSNPKLLPDNTLVSLFQKHLTKEEFDKMVQDKSKEHIVGIMRNMVNELHNQNDPGFKTHLIRTITDFIAGMTDKFAISQYHMLYGSDNFWN